MLDVAIERNANPARAGAQRSSFDSAVSSMSHWTEQDRFIFVAAFISKKPWQLTAHEMGLTQHEFNARKRTILRRFMSAA